jgi:hypothetical protein
MTMRDVLQQLLHELERVKVNSIREFGLSMVDERVLSVGRATLSQPEEAVVPLNIKDEYVHKYLWERALIAIEDPCARSHPHENMNAYCQHRTELARIQNQEKTT